MIEEQIEKLRSLQESYNDLADEVNVISNKIDNMQLPEINVEGLAKQGEDDTATNSKILQEVNSVKNTFDQLDIPLSAISGLALELEDGKKNIVDALKTRGIEASVESDTLTDLAAKVYDVKNPVVFTVPAETSNNWAHSFFNTMMRSQGLDEIYATVYETYCGENASYVGCLMSFMEKTKDSIELSGADAYYIFEEDTYYITGENGNLQQFLNGSLVQLSNKIHTWNANDKRTTRCVFYLYKANSIANGEREKLHNCIVDYCKDSIIPCLTYAYNSGIYVHFEVNNIDTCDLKYLGTTINTRMIYFFCNITECRYNANHCYTSTNASQLLFWDMPNLRKVTNSYVLSGGNVRNIKFDNLEELEGGILVTASENCIHFKFPKLRISEGCTMFYTQPNKSRKKSICTIELPSCERIYNGYDTGNFSAFEYLADVVHLHMKDGIIIGQLMHNVSADLPDANVKELYVNCKEIYVDERMLKSPRYPCLTGEKIFFNALRKAHLWFGSSASYTCFTKYIYINCIGGRNDEIYFQVDKYSMYMNAHLVTDLEISQGARQPLTFPGFNRLTADNIVNHIFERLADNRFEDDGVTPAPAITITIGVDNLAKLTDEQKAIATDKNYILA